MQERDALFQGPYGGALNAKMRVRATRCICTSDTMGKHHFEIQFAWVDDKAAAHGTIDVAVGKWEGEGPAIVKLPEEGLKVSLKETHDFLMLTY